LKSILISFSLLLMFIGSGLAQTSVSDTATKRIFLMGEDENQMDMLNKTYTTLLMTVCQNNMDIAYDKWMTMLTDMESYADKLGYDIKGTKMWMNVYWDKSGNIDYIGYYLKPNSRNVKTEEFSAFLLNFVRHYRSNLTYSAKYYHNGSVSFPTHYKFLKSQEEKNKK